MTLIHMQAQTCRNCGIGCLEQLGGPGGTEGRARGQPWFSFLDKAMESQGQRKPTGNFILLPFPCQVLLCSVPSLCLWPGINTSHGGSASCASPLHLRSCWLYHADFMKTSFHLLVFSLLIELYKILWASLCHSLSGIWRQLSALHWVFFSR